MRKKLYYFHYVINKTGRLIFFSHPTMPGPARVLMVRRQRREQDDYRPQMPAATVGRKWALWYWLHRRELAL
jgi:hypothetical protein